MDAQQEKKLAIDYITSFYLDLHNLKHWRALYFNNQALVIVEKQIESIDPENTSKEAMTILQNIKYYLSQVDIGFNTLAEEINISPESITAINKEYDELAKGIPRNKFIIDDAKLRLYILNMSKLIFKSAIKELLRDNQDLVNGIFNGTNTNSS